MGNFCSNCGAKVRINAKFCYACGAPTGNVVEPDNKVALQQTQELTNSATRQVEFAGKVLKCPNCGAIISQTTAVCPECGYYITGVGAVRSVQIFKDQLMQIEATRKRSLLGMLNIYAPPSTADKQILALIRNYPIPNTVEDILEFMMITTANINVEESKRTWVAKSRTGLLAVEMPGIISDAWVAKMQQTYQKAKILFPNEEAFKVIKEMYAAKMKELRMKVED